MLEHSMRQTTLGMRLANSPRKPEVAQAAQAAQVKQEKGKSGSMYLVRKPSAEKVVNGCGGAEVS